MSVNEENIVTNDTKPKLSQQLSRPNGNIMLPWDRFSNWINAILVVTFDIEMGQSLENIYPSHVKLTQNEKANICYMSFPDSNSGFLGDTQFHFRLKQDAHNTNTNSFSLNHSHNFEFYNRKTLNGLEVDKNHLFGYVFFRQVKDRTLKRGYFQKSVVLLSKLPFVSFFNQLLSLIATEYFSTGSEVIECACHDIDKWPLPIPGELLSLPILGHLIELALPVKIDKYALPIIYKKEAPAVPVTLPAVHEVNLYKSLQPILIHIHLLWELILLNEPIVVIGTVPNACSDLVQALISTIWPLKYASDYRPFFTIHNSEFSEYSCKNNIPPGLVIGVTNPFFTKCLQHWPNIIKIGEMTNKSLNSLDEKNVEQTNKPAKIKKTNNLKVVDSKPAVYTRYDCCLNKNKEILKNIIKGSETNRPPEAQSAILRRHFVEMTQSFMIPLERYFSSLMPLHKSISPFKSPPSLKLFDADEFMRNLKQAGPELTPNLKGDLLALYRRFFDSLNFKYWLEQKRKEAEKKLELLQIQLLCDYDMNKWLKSKQEIEIIDQYMNLKKKLDSIENGKIEANEQIIFKLKEIINAFLNALPEDMRSILKK